MRLSLLVAAVNLSKSLNCTLPPVRHSAMKVRRIDDDNTLEIIVHAEMFHRLLSPRIMQ